MHLSDPSHTAKSEKGDGPLTAQQPYKADEVQRMGEETEWQVLAARQHAARGHCHNRYASGPEPKNRSGKGYFRLLVTRSGEGVCEVAIV